MHLAPPSSRAVRALGLALVLVAALASAVRAAGAGQSEQSEKGEKEARRLFQKAELSFNVGKFAEALADYQAAYEAKPLPGFLFNIAQCYRNMGDYERARFFFRRYLTLDPRTPNRRRVEALIDEMTRKLPEQAEKAQEKPAEPPPAAKPEVAKAEPEPAEVPPPVPAPPLPVAAAPIDAQPAPAAPVLASEPQPEPSPAWKRWWFWTAAGVIVAGGVAAAIILTRPETRAPGTLDPIDGR
jgi:tetratricopeptide (TPR) repeat protein